MVQRLVTGTWLAVPQNQWQLAQRVFEAKKRQPNRFVSTQDQIKKISALQMSIKKDHESAPTASPKH